MNAIFKILSAAVIFSCGLLPYHYAQAQCLLANDDLSKVADVDMLEIQNFNIDLFKLVAPKDPKRNFVFSPYSIWNALVLAYVGSAGETEKQFQKVLRVPNKLSAIKNWRELDYMYKMRPETSVNNTFVVSNRAYFDKSVYLRLCVEDILHNELQQLDFANNPSGAANEINNFVSETTRGHITQLVSPNDIMFAHLVLVNAAFFKGQWTSPFDPKKNLIQPFETLDGEKINVTMMTQFGEFFYGYDDEVKVEVLQLPYSGNVISMYIFLPYYNSKTDFDTLMDSLTSATFNRIFGNMFESKTHVFLPKFSLESVIEDELIRALSKMGLTDPFIKGQANFTDFSFNPSLYLDSSIHKAFIDVNEEGTEAGAATAFIVNKIAGSRFICDRPFLFAIRDSETQNLLFLGTFKRPPSNQNPAQISSNTLRSINGLG